MSVLLVNEITQIVTEHEVLLNSTVRSV